MRWTWAASFTWLLLAWPGTTLAEEGDAAAGKKVFNKCRACHVADEDINKTGPGLKGVVGRRAASHPDYKFSDAMTKAGEEGLVWDEAHLTDFLRNPKAMTGTKMSFLGLKKDQEIADLIAYLKQVSQ